MYTIAMIVPYFGKLPSHFPFWLKSVEENPTVDFFLYSDNPEPKNCPANIKWKYMEFSQFKQKLDGLLGFSSRLPTPYKLCDVKPTYGDLFYEDIKRYDFWGFCDVDLIFGRIREFIADDLMNQFDKIGEHGHFVILRNSQQMRKMYRQPVGKEYPYKTIYRCKENLSFNEGGNGEYGFPKICERNHVKAMWERWFADVYTESFSFQHKQYIKEQSHYQSFEYAVFSEGKLLLKNTDGSDKEVMYIHFQSRNMIWTGNAVTETFYMIPNRILTDLQARKDADRIADEIEFAKRRRQKRKKAFAKKIRLLCFFLVRPQTWKIGWIRYII